MAKQPQINFTHKRIIVSPQRQKIAAILNDPDFQARFKKNIEAGIQTIKLTRSEDK